MHNKKLDQIVTRLESHLECWKQFNSFVNLARSGKFSAEEENQFLEVKAIIVQDMELILSDVVCESPTREDVHALIGSAPSLRYLGESNEGALRGVENNWHKIYVAFQAILGQLKVRQRDLEERSYITAFFRKNKP